MPEDRSRDWHAATLSRIKEARQKQIGNRLGSEKSRQGCVTCKRRKVKCDQVRPLCQRCQQAGRSCEGYKEVSSRSPRSSRSRSISPISQNLVTLPALEADARRTFDFFVAHVAERLGGGLDHDLWATNVLQAAHAQPFILDSVLAISILYEHPQYRQSLRSRHDHGDIPRQDALAWSAPTATSLSRQHARALTLYNRAIVGFRDVLASGGVSHELALLSCVLFVCIDMIRDDVFKSLSLIAHGARLLAQSSVSSNAQTEEPLKKMLKATLARLSVLAASYGYSQPLNLIQACGSRDTLISFRDLEGARDALFGVIGEADSYARAASIYAADEDSSFVPVTSMFVPSMGSFLKEFPGRGYLALALPVTPGQWQTGLEWQSPVLQSADNTEAQTGASDSQPRSIEQLLTRQKYLQDRLDAWYQTFQTFSKDEAGAASCSLLIHYHTAYISVSTRPANDEMVFDQHKHRFEQIVDNAEQYLRISGFAQATFTFEVGVVGPLFVVVFKCRYPSIRRRALRLLSQTPRKEALWGAPGVAELAARLIAIEEEGMGLPIPSANDNTGLFTHEVDDTLLPPATGRIYSVDRLREHNAGTFEVEITRFKDDGTAPGQLSRQPETFVL